MNIVSEHLRHIALHIKNSFMDLSLVVGIIVLFQLTVVGSLPENWPLLLFGLGIVGLGLAVFLRGLEIGVFPLGEQLAKFLAVHKRRYWVVIFAFVIGFATTVAEPALIAIAAKAAVVSGGILDATLLRLVVALSVGIAIVLGVVRIMLGHPIHWYIITGYALVVLTTIIAPAEIVALAYDSGGVTTSTVTVPLIAALGIGLASRIPGRNPVIDGFGLIAFASLTPMIFVQLYGWLAYNFLESAGPVSASDLLVEPESINYFLEFLSSVGDILPIMAVIGFFYYVVLHHKIEHIWTRIVGFGMVAVGLFAFVIGLEIGLFPVGEQLAIALAATGLPIVIYLFALSIGFATTIAEPTLTVIAKKAQEISGGALDQLYLRIFVALGVGIGILLGTYRIMSGDSIVLYIVAGYIVVVVLTIYAPRTIIPIAYDSGGVTTSTITVPIVAALGLGVATTVPGRDPLIDGFGLIAFASLFPIISVLAYGVFEQRKVYIHEERLKRREQTTVDSIVAKLSTVDFLPNKPKTKTKKPRIITITGMPGSGTTSVVGILGMALRYRVFSSGEIFRRVAESQGIDISRLNKIASKQEEIDHYIDNLIKDLGRSEERIIIDSRLGYHWIQDSFKVFLKVNSKEAAHRIQKHTKDLDPESSMTLEEARLVNKEQLSDEKNRFMDMYGIDISNTRPFDCVIDTSEKTVEQVSREIETAYREWQKE